MIGWSGLLLVIILSFIFILNRRGRKGLQASLGELSSRVAQVEELLLEICAVLEEKERIFEPLPAEAEEALPEDESNVLSPQLLPHTEVEVSPPAGERKPAREERPEPGVEDEIRELLIGEKKAPHQKRPEPETKGKTGKNLSEQPKQKPQEKPGDQAREKAVEKRPGQTGTAAGEKNEVGLVENVKPSQQATSSSRGKEINRARLEKIDPTKLPERSRKIFELLQQGLSVKEIARSTGMGQGEVQLIIDLYLQ
mgnify:CR=1 FL=1